TLNHTQVLIGGILEGAIGVGLWGVAPAYLAERFPTAARGAGPGAAYHVGAAIGSFTPTLQALFHRGGMSLGQSIGITIAMALVALAIVVAAGPEPAAPHRCSGGFARSGRAGPRRPRSCRRHRWPWCPRRAQRVRPERPASTRRWAPTVCRWHTAAAPCYRRSPLKA